MASRPSVADMVKDVIPHDIFALLLYIDKQQGLRIRYARGHRDEVVKNLLIPLGEGITGIAAETRQPILVNDVRSDSRYLNALDAVRSKPDRVCPLVCGKGERVTGDRCTQIVCASNFVLDSDGICRRLLDLPRKPITASRHERRATKPSAFGGGRDSCYGDCEGD